MKEIQPLDSVHAPTKKYTYNLDGVAPENIVVELKNNANYTVVRYYYDGFAQLVQLKNDIEDSTQVVKNIFYDGLGRVKAEENPYFANTSSAISNLTDAANTTYSYDALDRVIGVRNPDGTSKNITYSRWNITDFDENGNRIQYTLDGFGQIANVTERYNDPFIFINESYVTSYRYDTNGNLIKITDSLGNEFKFGYDSLNRKISMDDPDLGHWDYRYDQNGNLIRQNDSRNKPITITYDALNRVITKNSSEVNITFGYDQQYQGTLSNISMRTVNTTYKYDQRLRTTKETKIINGLSFETKFFYDSQNRVISKEGLSELDFIYNKQSKVQQIPNYITAANYNAFGSILNRTYANGLIQNFSYNTQNNRLTMIRIPSVQNLAYAYDSVGNILTITDAQNNRDHTLTYDTLNRLITAKVGPDRFTYAYNPTGNILKIVRNNNESKKFIYGGLAHAPSQVVEGSAGIDVYHLQEINSTNKSRTVEFYLVNDQNQSVSVNYTVNFGDGTSFTNNTGITVTDYTKATVNHTYAGGGQYDINVSITSGGASDQQQITPKFGLLAQNLTIISQNISNFTFGFTIKNSMATQMAENVSWNCSNGVRADSAVNLSGSQSVFNYVYYNFSRPGSFDFTCTGTSLDGTDSATAAVTVPGLAVENYNIISENISQRIIGFEVKNYFHPLSTAINVTTEGTSFVSSSFNLTNEQNIMAFVELNYTTDGVKTITIVGSGQNVNTTSVQTIDLLPVTIENYQRFIENSTRKIFFFDVKNNWVNGTSVRWNITDPALNGTVSLGLNQSLMVMIEHNYTTQGVKIPVISAAALTAWDTVYDYFTIKPIELWQLNTLSDSQLGAVVELVIKNNLNHSQNFSWRFDSGVENITSTQNIQLQNVSPIFVYIGFNYSTAGVYGTNAIVNSSMFSDNQTGVVAN